MKYGLLTILFAVLPCLGANYSTVDGFPKFVANQEQFSFYWGLWREKDESGYVVSKRTIRWLVSECETMKKINENGETFWYLDTASSETPLYFSMVNFNSLFAKGQLPFMAPDRVAGETLRDYQLRKKRAYLDWKSKASIKGLNGQIRLSIEHRLYETWSEKFITSDSYESPLSPYYQRFLPFRSDRWPQYFDERAHKPHTDLEPRSWSYAPKESESFSGVLEWEACKENISAVFRIPKGRLPAPGPNRPGRPSTASTNLNIVEE